MRAGLNAFGYTIIEVMIFLAISGFMFLTAASFVSGKQAESEFRQSVNETNSTVLRTINDVTNGYYPSGDDIKCTVSDSGGQPTTEENASGPKQGENGGCVFMGKIIQFKAGGDPHAYTIYSVVGRQYVSAFGSEVPTTFSQAQPALVEAASVTDSNTIAWGSAVDKVFGTGSGDAVYAIGIFNGFGKYTASMLASGAQTGLVVPITDGTDGTDIDSIKGALDRPGDLDQYLKDHPNPSFTVCLDSGRTKFGSLTIGSLVGQRLSSDYKIGSKAEVGC